MGGGGKEEVEGVEGERGGGRRIEKKNEKGRGKRERGKGKLEEGEGKRQEEER